MAPSIRFFVVTLLIAAASCHPQYQAPAEQVVSTNQCGYSSSYDCVPYLQCRDGVINTDGAGLIDVRVKPQGTCVLPEYPDVVALCCLIPGAIPTPAPLTTCPFGNECVDTNLCSATGVIVTDGSGFIDIRAGHTTCYQASGRVGVCCAPPRFILDNCPSGSVCVLNGNCIGQALNAADSFISYVSSGSWQECHLQHGNTGVCCQQTILDYCPSDSVCVGHGQCIGTALNPHNAFIDYEQIGSWQQCVGNGFNGVCCKQTILDFCPPDSVCLAHGQCIGTALNPQNNFIDYIQTGSWQQCVGNGFNGVCCKQTILNFCPDSVCLPHGQCKGTALNPQNNFNDYIQTGSWQQCIGNGYNGVCCKQTILDYCPSDSVCVNHGQCIGTALNPFDSFVDYVETGSWQQCTGIGYNGVCCKQTFKVLDYCPGDSKCLSNDQCYTTALNQYDDFVQYAIGSDVFKECNLGIGHGHGVCCSPPPKKIVDCPLHSECVGYGVCTGDAMGPDGGFLPYNPIGIWGNCNLGAGYTDNGVCCKVQKRVDPIAADKCGVRNYHIDQRIQASSYADNEAAFGEFPWQTIIFYKNYTFKCGASLISNKHVITAAHCVHSLLPGEIKLRFGEWQVNTFDEPLEYLDMDVSFIYNHPDYNPKNVHNDIAVLELTDYIPLKFHINTVCLPGLNHKYTKLHQCIATGWGKDSFEGKFQHILKKIELPFVDHYQCQEYLRKTRLGKYFILDDSFMCAGGIANEDACYGDGGGPLVCKDSITSQYFLAGITSWGIGCGSQDVPGVYADVSKFSQWVENIVLSPSDLTQSVVGYGK